MVTAAAILGLFKILKIGNFQTRFIQGKSMHYQYYFFISLIWSIINNLWPTLNVVNAYQMRTRLSKKSRNWHFFKANFQQNYADFAIFHPLISESAPIAYSCQVYCCIQPWYLCKKNNNTNNKYKISMEYYLVSQKFNVKDNKN